MCAPRYKYLVVLSLRDDASNTLMEHSESVPHSALSFPSGVGIRKQPNIYQASRTIKTDCCRKCRKMSMLDFSFWKSQNDICCFVLLNNNLA